MPPTSMNVYVEIVIVLARIQIQDKQVQKRIDIPQLLVMETLCDLYFGFTRDPDV